MRNFCQHYSTIFIITLLLNSSTILGQNLSFNHLGVNDGLSQVSVTKLAQDNLGRIWIGTRDGVNVYDGNSIKTYRSIRGNENSLLGYSVRDIVTIGHHVYIITKSGISILNTKTQIFCRHTKADTRCCTSFQNSILVGTSHGLLIYESESNTFRSAQRILSDSLSVETLYIDRAGILWIGTTKGLYIHYPNKQKTQKINDEHITAVLSDSQKRIWIGTKNNGVFVYNSRYQYIAHLIHSNQSNTLVNNTVRSIEEDPHGNMWIGTFLGLSIVDSNSFSITNYQHNETDIHSISHNSVYSIIKDQQGNMWVGTYFGGINYLNNDLNVFETYEISSDHSTNGLSFPVIGEMLEDQYNNIWIATEGGGLNYYDRKKNQFKHYYNYGKKNDISGNNIKDILQVDKNTLYIGTYTGGLNILNQKTKNITTFPNSSIKTINEITPFRNYYLLGTRQGVVRFDPQTQEFSPFFTNPEDIKKIGNSILCMFEDSFGKLWIGTEENGLLSYDADLKELKSYLFSSKDLSTISSNTISCIYEDHLFRLWIGTYGGGLNLYNKKGDNFINYNQIEHGLSSDFIQSMIESRYGNLWITCSKGISRFDVENKKIYNYTQKNGLPLHEINEEALLLTKDGEMFVGGVNGLISFNEKDLLMRENKFHILFSSLSVNNKTVTPIHHNEIIESDLPYCDKITLQHDQNMFTIRCASSNYIKTNPNTYQYKLENFDNEWMNAGYRTSFTYTNLDIGEYTFWVRGVSGIDQKIIDTQKITIEVLPPVYYQWYAIVFYLLVLSSLLYWLFINFRSKVKLVNRIELEQKEKEQIIQLNQSKLNFFTHISHEFRTPLTLITGTLESILRDKKTTRGNYKKLLITHNNAVRLNNLITELLDFRKLENGKLKLHVMEYDINQFVDDVSHSFQNYAEAHKIDLHVISLSTSKKVWFDKIQMEKVLFNLLSNAFKFIEEKTGMVSITITETVSSIRISVADNGIGMKADKIEHIFDQYYQIDNLKNKHFKHSSGIGLALCKNIIEKHRGSITIKSEEGEGTEFVISLQKGFGHFKQEDLIKETAKEIQSISSELLLPIKETVEDIQESDGAEEPERAVILLVEDNLEVLNLLSSLLAPLYKLLIANNGKQGFDKAMKLQPDLILSDIMMPEMNGTEMCALLKRNIQTCHIPIILLSAKASVQYRLDGLETGADDYITKPFHVDLLLARIKTTIQNRHILQQKFKQDPSVNARELSTNSMDTELLQKATEIIERNIDNSEFDIQEFANEMGLGRTKLYAKIKGVTGQTPNDFLLSIRLKKAAEFLLEKNGEMNISEIAYAVGFSTPRYFSRCFREHYGVLPSKYGKEEVSEK